MSLTSVSACVGRALAVLPSGPILVAYSGGVDSHALLHALSHNEQARDRGLRAVHVDHGLHADSAAWAQHCASVCTALDLPLTTLRVDVDRNSGMGIEDAAREARMNAFRGALHAGEILSLAQHRDDQAETVLLKLLRGAGPQGLGGMRVLRAWGARNWLWRPLLDLPRAVLQSYADEHALRIVEDPSNADTHLRRNFLRARILPSLRERWPDAQAALAHSATWARAAADFIADHAREALAQLRNAKNLSVIDAACWLALPDALRDPVLRDWLRELRLDEPAHFHMRELEKQLRDSAPDRSPCVRFGQTELRRYRGELHAMRALEPVRPDWHVVWHGERLPLPGGGALEAIPTSSGLASSARLDTPALVRFRCGGERLKPAGAAHTRDLRLLLQEAGVVPWLRDRLPLVCVDGDLVAVADLYLSDAGAALCSRSGSRLAWSRA